MKVLIDTSAFYALEDSSDRHHVDAKKLRDGLRDSRFRLFTTNLVLAESITLIGIRLGPRHATRFAELAYGSKRMHVIRLTEHLERASIERHARYADSTLSMTDASLIEIAERHGVERVFAFDRHFVQYGRTPLSRGDFAPG